MNKQPILFLFTLFTVLFVNIFTVIAQEIPEPVSGEIIYIPFPVDITVDGQIDDWLDVPFVEVTTGSIPSADPEENGSYLFSVAADNENIYLTIQMADKTIIAGEHGPNYWNEDSLEFFFNFSDDINALAYDNSIFQAIISPIDMGNENPTDLTVTGINVADLEITGYVFETENGWGIEVAIPYDGIEHGKNVGIQTQANGASELDRNVKLIWSKADTTDLSWQNPSLFGTGIFFELGSDDIPSTVTRIQSTPAPINQALPEHIRINQVGYAPDSSKIAMFHHDSTEELAWSLWNSTGSLIKNGNSTYIGKDLPSGDNVHHIEFSDISAEGVYYLKADNLESPTFRISANIYDDLQQDALAYFYRSRAGIEIVAEFAGDAYARQAGHLSDSEITCFTGTDSQQVEWDGCDYTIDVSKGWYDAGDYGKYVVNSGIATWTLLNQYERNPSAFPDGSLSIPEQANGIPDILDEARWNIEFMLGMQVPEGYPQAGMVHHKLHALAWEKMPSLPPMETEDEEYEIRYAMPPSTAATLDTAAIGAQCARIWKDIDPEFSDRCLVAANRAWEAAGANENFYYGNIPGSGGGNYDDTNVSDERYWAAAELFITTNEPIYLSEIQDSVHFQTLSRDSAAMAWVQVDALGSLSLSILESDLPNEDLARIRADVVRTANQYIETMQKDGYHSLITDYVWGSNSAVLNNMIILGYAYEFTQDTTYLNAMSEGMDYILGRNALGYSFVTGYGRYAASHPHHRFWANQGEYPAPPSGVVTGGVNEQASDSPSDQANLLQEPRAKRYVDHIDSYSTNEVTINWNAPLAWTSAFLAEKYNQRTSSRTQLEIDPILLRELVEDPQKFVLFITPMPPTPSLLPERVEETEPTGIPAEAKPIDAPVPTETPSTESGKRDLNVVIPLSIAGICGVGTAIFLSRKGDDE